MERIIAKLVHDFERGTMTRRQLIQALALTATASSVTSDAAAAATPATKALSINHVSYQVADYAKTRDFYAELFGMAVSNDDGKQCYLNLGDTFLVARTSTPAPRVDHISYTLANWDDDKTVRAALEAELKSRGVQFRGTAGGLHIPDPDGFDVQVGGKKQ